MGNILDDPLTIELIRGVGGLSLYINEYRVCGPKPWGGGICEKKWVVKNRDLGDLAKSLVDYGRNEMKKLGHRAGR